MKAKILLVVYILLSIGLIYTRVVDDFEIYKIIKYSLVTSLIAYYLTKAKTICYKFSLILMFYLLSDIVFTISPWHQFFGFGSLLVANTMLSTYILNKTKVISVSLFYKILVALVLVLSVSLSVFYDNKKFQSILIILFYISIGLTFVTAYYRYTKTLKPYSLWMLLSTMSFVFSNFMSNLNYFIYKNAYFSGLSSFFYVFFLFGVTHSVIVEDEDISESIRTLNLFSR